MVHARASALHSCCIKRNHYSIVVIIQNEVALFPVIMGCTSVWEDGWWNCYDFIIRPGKLNSQFIVTNFSVLHAGGRSLFRFHISYSV